MTPGDAVSHLRADHTRGAWRAGLALETLRRESWHTEMSRATQQKARPRQPSPHPRTVDVPALISKGHFSCFILREFQEGREARQISFTSCFPLPWLMLRNMF